MCEYALPASQTSTFGRAADLCTVVWIARKSLIVAKMVRPQIVFQKHAFVYIFVSCLFTISNNRGFTKNAYFQSHHHMNCTLLCDFHEPLLLFHQNAFNFTSIDETAQIILILIYFLLCPVHCALIRECEMFPTYLLHHCENCTQYYSSTLGSSKITISALLPDTGGKMSLQVYRQKISPSGFTYKI